MRWLSKFVYFKLLRWKVVGNINLSKNTIKKAVIIAAPHTSWHDFYIGVLLRSVIKVKTNFIAKKSLFKFPFGWFFKSLGGTPVNRFSNENKVQAIVEIFNNHDEFRITLAPEGTRKKVLQWRTGFYFIAKKANVPIIMITFDYKNKQNKISEPFYPTNNKEADFSFMQDFFKNVEGKIPEYS
ncbi:acyltransferase [Seonamhaeicola algicola]|uniref:Acyltransferase n=1 Tax=Seonamhaeicola algicola TaxID=1719036 RepID=A0A5C7AVC4_9FLAO|nr:1-acyl-sn-glycerol-3-phosphate acyltransferase [Seonamhaeicola algicola]TXE11539.1 acyltransferase [Seonamhaeicola algicola]